MSVIQFQDVTVAINNVPLLRQLNLEIHQGETLVLLGESGSGKTTTLKLINRLLVPTAGRVIVDSKHTLEWDPIALRRRIGYVIQEIGLFPHFNVRKNVGLVPFLERWDRDRIESRVNEVLKLVGLDPERFLDRYPHELSGGQRQRVGVARALAADPEILLLDEPFGALDPITRSEIQREFRELHKTLRKTTVFVTHDVTEALLLGSRIGLMVEGKLCSLAGAKEFAQSHDPEVEKFLQPLRDLGIL